MADTTFYPSAEILVVNMVLNVRLIRDGENGGKGV